jgi:hypothetical protein
VRQWTPRAALAQCPQPYNSPAPYGIAPYAHAEHFNAMVAPFGTGPTAVRAVAWYQAESDSYPQTPPGYLTCQTTRQVTAWRALLQSPALPWLLVQVCTCTADAYAPLRQEQFAATVLPAVYSVPSFDYGDADSPYGNVHSRYKQVVGARLASVALRYVYGTPLPPGPATYASYPPPTFLDLAVSTAGAAIAANITLDASGGSPVLAVANLTCPASVGPQYCGASPFALQTNDTAWWPATLAGVVNDAASATATLTLTATLPANVSGTLYAVGAAYAWQSWPLATLVTADGWPVLAFNQSVIMLPPF